MKEIERKYLLDKSILEFLKTTPVSCQKIMQFYTKVNEEKSVRYRQYNGKYVHCIKQGTGGIRKETENEISEKSFEKYRKKHIGSPVKKLRCLLSLEGKEFSIDIYKKALIGLHIMEIEFESVEKYENFILPSLLAPYVKREVTEDETYKNKNLSLFGLPCIQQITNKATVIETLKEIFESNLNDILHYRAKVLDGGTEEDLHKLRISIRKVTVLMGEFKLVFTDKETLHEDRESLKSIIEKSNAKRDLDVLKEKLTHSTSIHNKHKHEIFHILLNEIDEDLIIETERFLQFLEGPLCKSILKRWKKRIKNMGDSDTSIYGRYTMDPVYKYVVFKRFLKIKKQMRALEENSNANITLHQLRISFKHIRYLLETFADSTEKKQSKKLLHEIKKLQDSLGLYHDSQTQKKLFDDLYKQHKNKRIRDFIKKVFLSQLKTYQKTEIRQITKQLKSFLMKENIYRKIFT